MRFAARRGLGDDFCASNWRRVSLSRAPDQNEVRIATVSLNQTILLPLYVNSLVNNAISCLRKRTIHALEITFKQISLIQGYIVSGGCVVCTPYVQLLTCWMHDLLTFEEGFSSHIELVKTPHFGTGR
jgi:hypothetical protein